MSRTIKRYENRKLYDTEKRKYISLEEIAMLIREGVDVQVMDKATNEDITTQTLTQVIFEEGKKGRNPFSKEMLHDVIRWGSSVLDGRLQQLKQTLDHFVPSSLNRLLGGAQSEELNQLKKKIESLEATVSELVAERDINQQTKKT